jgi:protein-S-isoprenylcysteine O-methyltransferase Ste14
LPTPFNNITHTLEKLNKILNLRTLQRLRVPFGFLFAIVFIIFAKPQVLTLIIGAFVAIIGLIIRGWASGHIRKNADLAISGPYAYTRNPLYVGSFLLGVGFTIASSVWWLVLVFAAMFLLIYLPVMKAEVKDLIFLFGEKFEEYAANVPLFIPRLTSWKKSDEKFDFELYLKYREYRASLGLVIAWLLLTVKMYFQG